MKKWGTKSRDNVPLTEHYEDKTNIPISLMWVVLFLLLKEKDLLYTIE